jgi:RNA polymerase sigma-32 factor
MTTYTEQRNNFSSYLRDIGRLALLTREQELEIARRWQDERDPRAAEELVSRNLRFVVKVARSYRRYGMSMADLVQEGNLGLMHAVEKFDPSRGTRLLSYAVWWIKAYMQAHVIRSWSLVRIGTTQSQRRLFHKLPRALAEGPNDGEAYDDYIARLATELDARPRDVKLMMGVVKGRDLSLDSPLRPGESQLSFLDRVEDPRPDPELCTEEGQDHNLRARLLAEALDKIGDRERAIIELRHCSDEPRTLREVGDILGLSRERVRQLENKAMIKLRRLVQSRYELATAA